MTKEYSVSTMWEAHIEPAELSKCWDRGTFCLLNQKELIVAYNQSEEHGLNNVGRIARVVDGKVKDIFETKRFWYVWAPVVDDEGAIYVAESSAFHADVGRHDPSTLYKINSGNQVAWQYQFQGHEETLPVIYHDSVFVYDFKLPERVGRLNRLSKEGRLIWSVEFAGNTPYEPLILKDRNQVLLGLHSSEDWRGRNRMDILADLKTGKKNIRVSHGTILAAALIIDMDGNKQAERKMGTDLFGWLSRGKSGVIYACVGHSIQAWDDNLDTLWRYKHAVENASRPSWVEDASGYVYCHLSGRKLFSLDSHGGLRWIAATSGDVGYEPCILENGNILMVTSGWNGGKNSWEQNESTYLEVYSVDGEKIFGHELPGSIFYATVVDDNTVFLAVNLLRTVRGKHEIKRAVKIYSLKLC